MSIFLNNTLLKLKFVLKDENQSLENIRVINERPVHNPLIETLLAALNTSKINYSDRFHKLTPSYREQKELESFPQPLEDVMQLVIQNFPKESFDTEKLNRNVLYYK